MNIPKEIALMGSKSVLEYIKFVESYNEIERKRDDLVKQIQIVQGEMRSLIKENSNHLSLRMLGLNYFGLKRERLHNHALKLQELSNVYLGLTLEFSAIESQLMKLYEESESKGILVGTYYIQYSKCSFG